MASEVSAPANAHLGIVGTETEQEVAAGCSAVAVHLGMSSEMLTGAEGVSANMATLVVSVVWRSEWKTGPCAAFDVEVAGQETNTTRGVSSNSGVGTGVRLPFGAGMGMGTELGGGDKWFGGSRRLEGGLLTGANLRTKGQKFLLYLLDPLLWRQLKGQYWRRAWRANQEGAGQSRWLTLIIKCSNKLFHGVNEDGELSGFSFRGRSKGQSEQKRTIACEHGSSSAVKDKACGVVDLF